MRHFKVLLKISVCALLLALAHSCNVREQKVSIDIVDKQNNKEIGKIELTGKDKFTEYEIVLFGLPPEKTFIINLYSGNCDMLSASSTIVSRINTDNNGNGKDSGILLFHDKESIILNKITDGEHLLVLESDTFWECIAIPVYK